MISKKGMERRLQISGILLIAGMIVELFSLLWTHPTAFLLFLFIGGTLLAAGILYYLYSVVSQSESTGNREPRN